MSQNVKESDISNTGRGNNQAVGNSNIQSTSKPVTVVKVIHNIGNLINATEDTRDKQEIQGPLTNKLKGLELIEQILKITNRQFVFEYETNIELLIIYAVHCKNDEFTQYLLQVVGKTSKNTIETFLKTNTSECVKHLISNIKILSQTEKYEQLIISFKKGLNSHINIDNFEEFLKLAQSVKFQPLIDEIKNFIEYQYINIFKNGKYNMLDVDLFDLFVSNCLEAKRDINIFINWIEHDKDNRIAHLHKLIMGIKDPKLNKTDVMSLYLKYNISNDKNISDIARMFEISTERLVVIENLEKKFMGKMIALKSEDFTIAEFIIFFLKIIISWPVETVFITVCQWISLDPKQRNQYKNVFMRSIKWNDLSDETMRSIMQKLESSNKENSLLTIRRKWNGDGETPEEIIIDMYYGSEKIWKPFWNTGRHVSGFPTVHIRDKLISIGGYDGNKRISDVTCLNIISKTITEMAPLNTARCSSTADVINGKLIVCGGIDGPSYTNVVEVMDIRKNEWTTVSPMNHKRANHCSVVHNNRLYVFGGRDDNENPINYVEWYCFEKDKWFDIEHMPESLRYCAATVLSNHIYIIGGQYYNKTDNEYFISKRVHIYDTVEDCWTTGPELPKLMDCVSAVTLNGEIIVSRGDCVLKYDAGNNRWIDHSKLLFDTHFHDLIIVNNLL